MLAVGCFHILQAELLSPMVFLKLLFVCQVDLILVLPAHLIVVNTKSGTIRALLALTPRYHFFIFGRRHSKSL